MAEASYSIKDLEHLSGIKAHTLRIWEQRYNLINPKRTGTNIRYYDQNDLKLILNVSLLKDHGHKISNIAKMSLEEMHQEVKKLAEKPSGFADQIYALTLSMIDLDEERFEKIISTNSLKLGFERTMLNIIYPFLSKIGIMWMTDSINPAQEHFISNLIRQKVIVAIDGQFHSAQSMDNAKKYMLFLPQGELHELSLLFASYLIQSRKNRVIYLGQNMPFEDLEAAYQVHKPDYLLTVMTSKPNGFSAQDYVSKLSEAFPETEILLSGSQVIGEDLSIPENIKQIANPHILVSFIEEQVTVAAK
ncbi:MerR family transcriptional regulator [Roseivirga pacifica]|uniref:MerR family transcriptional regulator n=1 Tax=Roseivirga pacifica TaxID=1267423 RepID=UPI0020956F32|nr:MerR family transcriptional regulator [Roseivirga pacifica]MCO6358997.1 MerR family transcriptional regulator [Roseivirga pacifica]MCO6365367.1 MerR family transcriptional regulator [Roseivirga pacifica]MCO6371903.1 MerR family transcriptional regulator [Roseivirga pacifica]MCO6375986.1 MerR family transcriptional regulator [Roseivirga pacifica]MCO6379281.1 MerR family transcriptional regulator [Roseivirga pacifica]